VAERVAFEFGPGGVVAEGDREDEAENGDDPGQRPDREDDEDDVVEPTALAPRLVAGRDRVGEAAVPGRAGVGRGVDVAGQRHQRVAQRMARRHLGQQRQRLVAVFDLEGAIGGLADQLDRVADLLGLVEAAMSLVGARAEVEADEDQVDQARRRLVEVVVVGGDELAELVDEEAEADAGDQRRHLAGAAAEQAEQDRQRHDHEDATPEQVGDVEAVAAELRVVGQVELGADAELGGDRGDEEGEVQAAEVGVARRPLQQVELHGVTLAIFSALCWRA